MTDALKLSEQVKEIYNEEYYRNWNAPALKVEAIKLHRELAEVMGELYKCKSGKESQR